MEKKKKDLTICVLLETRNWRQATYSKFHVRPITLKLAVSGAIDKLTAFLETILEGLQIIKKLTKYKIKNETEQKLGIWMIMKTANLIDLN